MKIKKILMGLVGISFAANLAYGFGTFNFDTGVNTPDPTLNINGKEIHMGNTPGLDMDTIDPDYKLKQKIKKNTINIKDDRVVNRYHVEEANTIDDVQELIYSIRRDINKRIAIEYIDEIKDALTKMRALIDEAYENNEIDSKTRFLENLEDISFIINQRMSKKLEKIDNSMELEIEDNLNYNSMNYNDYLFKILKYQGKIDKIKHPKEIEKLSLMFEQIRIAAYNNPNITDEQKKHILDTIQLLQAKLTKQVEKINKTLKMKQPKI